MHLRVLTYNIHRAIGVDRRFRPERIASIIGHYAADVVLLQEVDEGVPRSRGKDLARHLATDLGYPHHAVGHNVTLRKGRYGNATLSLYPIISERNIDLTIEPWKRRGCQHTAIALGGASHRRLDVFNLHLGLAVRQRTRQMTRLAASAEMTTLARHSPCLIGGDFNDWRSLLVSFITRDMGFGAALRPPHARPFATYPSFFPRGPLDRFYYRGSLKLLSIHRCGLWLSRVASDHLPLIADFEI